MLVKKPARSAWRGSWTLGFADEVWFSRLAQPSLHAWATGGERLRLEMHATARDDPKALACYGLKAARGGADAAALR
jgi:hypothetical protein